MITKKVEVRKSKMLKATWTVEPIQYDDTQHSEKLIEELNKIVQEEIDWEIMCDLLLKLGWTKIETSWDMKSLEETYEIKSWCENNLKGHREGRGKIWIFELEKDASMFALRWA